MFEGKTVAITGATGGIGRGIAEMFIAEGATVAISDYKPCDNTGKEIGASAYICDVSDETSVQKFIADVEADHGGIDIYVSNAGIGDANGKYVGGGSDSGWQRSWEINVMGSVYAARDLMPKWVERGSGRFVVTASAAGLLNQIGSASYSCTKHAAVSFAESIQIEHGADGIRANCICPQYVKSAMTDGMPMAENSRDGLLEPKDVANALKTSIEQDEFYVFSHPVVHEYFKHRALQPDAYLQGMQKLKQKVGEAFKKAKTSK